MNRFCFEQLGAQGIAKLLRPPAINDGDSESVRGIVREIALHGDDAARMFTKKFDGVTVEKFIVTEEEFIQAKRDTPEDVIAALSIAAKNIEQFHRAQIPTPVEVHTMPGVVCRREWRPINRIGLYVPGGSAPLISTVLML